VALAGSLTWPATAAGAVPLPNTTASGEWWFVTWDVAKIWGLGAQGQGVTVAVLDSGINPAAAGMANVVGPGTDMTAGGTGNGQPDTDESGHGTRMAAFIAGQSNEIGIAPRARILPVIVNSDIHSDQATYASAIRWSVDHGAKVINLSQGKDGVGNPGNCPPIVQGAVKDAVARGAVVVASSGNDGEGTNPAYYPAACKGVLAVGAIDLSIHAWAGTERQSYVDVAAPGVSMHTIDGQGKRVISDGTSDATALVSGAIALVWSKYPQLTNRQVVARVLATLRDDASTAGRDDATGGGIVRPYRAIVDNIPASAPNPVFDELDSLPSGPPPSGGPPPGGGSLPPCNAPPGPGQAVATVGPPPSGTTAAPPPPCSPSSAASDKGGGIPIVAVVLVGVAVVLVLVLIAIFASRRRRPKAYQGPQYPQYPQGPPQGPPSPPGSGWGGTPP
jgi:subtilisin family serine protease